MTSFVSSWRQNLRDALREVTDLVAPVTCCGCGAFDVQSTSTADTPVCTRCLPATTAQPRRVEHAASAWITRTTTPIWAAAIYDHVWREVILNFKNRGRSDGLPLLTRAAQTLATRIAAVIGASAGEHEHGHTLASDLRQRSPLLVLPAPARKPPWLSGREVDLPQFLADTVVRELRGHSIPSQCYPVLRNRRIARDQIGLTAAARKRNKVDAMRVTRNAELNGKRVFLIDDVLTTGATLRAAFNAATRQGATVLGALVVAATPKRSK